MISSMRIQSAFLALLAAALLLASSTTDASTRAGAAAAVHKQGGLDSISTTLDEYDDNHAVVALARGGGEPSAFVQDLLHRLKIASYFALWYALNIVYNIINKKVLNVLPAPLSVGSFQFGVGALYASLLWLTRLRTPPTLTPRGRKIISHIGLHHCVGQLLSMVSLGAGPVSFTHIVKALEPFFSALVSALLLGKWMKLPVYATLLPVVGGVGYACLKERSFSWLAFCTAMGSNVAFALRAVLSKTAMTTKEESSAKSQDDSSSLGTNLTSANVFGLVTWAAFLISIPIAYFGEGHDVLQKWNAAVEEQGNSRELVRACITSGLFHYLNNEVMYLALSNVHPVTLAVGNTMKRVFIMVASVLVFRNPVSLQAAVGAAIGISGVLLYSLTKQYYEQLEAQQEIAAKGKKGRAMKKNKQVTAGRNKRTAATTSRKR